MSTVRIQVVILVVNSIVNLIGNREMVNENENRCKGLNLFIYIDQAYIDFTVKSSLFEDGEGVHSYHKEYMVTFFSTGDCIQYVSSIRDSDDKV